MLSIGTILSIMFITCFFCWVAMKISHPKEEDNKIVWNEDTSYMYRHIPSRKARKKAQAVLKGRTYARGNGTSDKNAPTSKNITNMR